jgi:hypothetical protein
MMLADLDEFHTPDDKEGFNAIILGMAERVHNISDHSERAPRARQHLICTRLYPAPVSPCASLPTHSLPPHSLLPISCWGLSASPLLLHQSAAWRGSCSAPSMRRSSCSCSRTR